MEGCLPIPAHQSIQCLSLSWRECIPLFGWSSCRPRQPTPPWHSSYNNWYTSIPPSTLSWRLLLTMCFISSPLTLLLYRMALPSISMRLLPPWSRPRHGRLYRLFLTLQIRRCLRLKIIIMLRIRPLGTPRTVFLIWFLLIYIVPLPHSYHHLHWLNLPLILWLILRFNGWLRLVFIYWIW